MRWGLVFGMPLGVSGGLHLAFILLVPAGSYWCLVWPRCVLADDNLSRLHPDSSKGTWMEGRTMALLFVERVRVYFKDVMVSECNFEACMNCARARIHMALVHQKSKVERGHYIRFVGT
jgi:hypothetical protein